MGPYNVKFNNILEVSTVDCRLPTHSINPAQQPQVNLNNIYFSSFPSPLRDREYPKVSITSRWIKANHSIEVTSWQDISWGFDLFYHKVCEKHLKTKLFRNSALSTGGVKALVCWEGFQHGFTAAWRSGYVCLLFLSGASQRRKRIHVKCFCVFRPKMLFSIRNMSAPLGFWPVTKSLSVLLRLA